MSVCCAIAVTGSCGWLVVALTSYRKRVRLISGGVAALARRSPVGFSGTSRNGSNNSARVTPSA
jgi:hypothetical protein